MLIDSTDLTIPIPYVLATKVEFEPTYRTESMCKVPFNEIQDMMKQEMDEMLHDLDYNIFEAPNWSRVSTVSYHFLTHTSFPVEKL